MIPLPPPLKLALIFGKMAKDHGPKLLHANNINLLTKDLGTAMQRQKQILSNPVRGSIMTAYDVLPVIVEVKLLSLAVAKKLDIPTSGRPIIDVMEDIAEKADERDSSEYASGIKDTLEWTRKLFANPEIQDVLSMEVTDIEFPSRFAVRDIANFVNTLVARSQDELVRVDQFLKKAKDTTPPPAQKAEPPAEDSAEGTPPKKPDTPKKPAPPKGP